MKHMEKNKITSLNYILMFFLSYSFYSLQVLTQLLFNKYSKQSIVIICSMYVLLPIIIYLICKAINHNKINHNTKNNFTFSVLSSLYLILTCVISIVYISNIIIIYYYQQTSLIILLAFLILPIIYTIFKGSNSFFSLASVLLIIYIIFKYSYLSNYSHIDTYVFHNIFNIAKNDILVIILFSLPILLEPLLLINHQKDISDKINVKWTVLFSTIISLISILTILRQTWEFGSLLSQIRFPYLESIKNIVAGKFFENIDYYYLLSLAMSIYTRTSFTLISIKKSFNLKKSVTLIILLAILILVYFLRNSLQLNEFASNKILLITSTCLILLTFIFPFLIKRRAKQNV